MRFEIDGDDERNAVAALAGFADEVTALTDILAGHTTIAGSRPAVATRDWPASLVHLAARAVPAAQEVDLIVLRGGQPLALAASSPALEPLEELLAATGEGPGIDVLTIGEPVYSAELPADERWPRFAARAVTECGIRSIASYPVRITAGRVAALSFYSDWPYGFDRLALAAGALVAGVMSLAGCLCQAGGDPTLLTE